MPHWTHHLPAPLLGAGPRGLAIWQWLALPLLGLVAWTVGHLLSRLTRGLLARMARRTAASSSISAWSTWSRPAVSITTAP